MCTVKVCTSVYGEGGPCVTTFRYSGHGSDTVYMNIWTCVYRCVFADGPTYGEFVYMWVYTKGVCLLLNALFYEDRSNSVLVHYCNRLQSNQKSNLDKNINK